MLDSRFGDTQRLMRLVRHFAATHRIPKLRDKADMIMYYMSSDEAEGRRKSGVVRGLTELTSTLEDIKSRMRSKEKIAASEGLLLIFSETLPELIARWENFDELRLAIVRLVDVLQMRFHLGNRASPEDKLVLAELEAVANHTMVQPKVTYETIEKILQLSETLYTSAEEFINMSNVGNAATALKAGGPILIVSNNFDANNLEDVKQALVKLEIIALVQCE